MAHETAIIKGHDMDGNYIEELVELDGTNPVVTKARFDLSKIIEAVRPKSSNEGVVHIEETPISSSFTLTLSDEENLNV